MTLNSPDLWRHLSSALLWIGGIISIAGAAILWSSYGYRQRIPVDAEITKSELVVGGIKSKRMAQWMFELEYRYQVDGKDFTSRDYSYQGQPQSPAGEGSEPSETLRALVAQYPVGSKVKAFVSPSDPTRAMLVIPKRPLVEVLAVGLGLLLLALMIKFFKFV